MNTYLIVPENVIEIEKQENIKLTSNNFARELKNMKDENKPLCSMRFNRYSKQVHEHIEKQYPNLLKEFKKSK